MKAGWIKREPFLGPEGTRMDKKAQQDTFHGVERQQVSQDFLHIHRYFPVKFPLLTPSKNPTPFLGVKFFFKVFFKFRFLNAFTKYF